MKGEKGGIYVTKSAKTLLLLIILIFLLSVITLFAEQSYGQLIDVDTVANIQEYPPELIGVNQEILFYFNVTPTPPPFMNVLHDFQIVITKPDGSSDILGPINSDYTGGMFAFYTPDQVGNYDVEFIYPGEIFDSSNRNYLSSSDTTSFNVQEEPVIIRSPSAEVTVSPDPVGINQMVEIGITFAPLPPSDTDVFHDFYVYIFNTTRYFGPFDSSTNGTYYFHYATPAVANNYSAYVWYPGEWFPVGDNYYGEYYFIISGPEFPFLVQNDAVFLPLTISTAGSGSTTPSAGVIDFEPGEEVTVIASPNSGWQFSHWILDGANVGIDPEYAISMFDDHELTAVFEEELPIPPEGSFNLRISISGSGTTNPSTGVQTYPAGTVQTVIATPASNWRFSHWLLDGASVSTNPNYIITMNANHELTAVFEQGGTDPNLPPEATIIQINPSSGRESAVQGESISFEGLGLDTDGFIVEYRWTSSIDGFLSASEAFSTSGLSVGTHTIYFDVRDNSGSWSNLASQTIRVVEGTALAIILGVTGGIFVPTVSVTAFHFYFRNRLPRYPPIHFGRFPTSNQVKQTLKEKTQKEQKEEEEERKNKSRRKKGKPLLTFEVQLPLNVSRSNSYEAQLTVKNYGLVKATQIKVDAAATPGLILDKTADSISVIKPAKDYHFVFPFKVDKFAKKGVYTLRFNVDSKETSSRKRYGYTRAVKIGLLTSSEKPKSFVQIKNWLEKNNYCWKEMGEDCDKINTLFAYDLVIIAPELKMPPKWVRNISTFVENSQSVLLIDKVITSENEVMAETFGYSKMRFEPFKIDKGTLKISQEHSITEGFGVEDKIPLSSCWGNPCKQTVTTGKIVAEFCDKNDRDSADIPAITYNEYGEGKTVHLNFHAEEFTEQLDSILKNAIKWLI